MATRLSNHSYFLWYAPAPDSQAHPREDAHVAAPRCRLFAVADGVSRDRQSDGSYPSPSPARAAAKRFCEAVAANACHDQDLSALFHEANEQIGRLNADLRLSDDPDYLGRDLAGVVAVAARQSLDRLDWCYLGDCGAALLGPQGTMLHRTPDDVSAVRSLFPSEQDLPDRDCRRVYIRSRLRNQPRQAGAYGVLTGEPAARRFIRTGSWPSHHAEVALIFSDGFRPYLDQNEVPKLLVRAVHDPKGSAEARRVLACVRDQRSQIDDEATVIAWSTRG